MALYRVTFAEQGGWTVTTRIRAPAGAAHATLAAQKIFGPHCYWAWFGASVGRVFEQVGEVPDPESDRPCLGPTRVTVQLASRRLVKQPQGR